MARRKQRSYQRRRRSPAFVFFIVAAIIAGALLYPLTRAERKPRMPARQAQALATATASPLAPPPVPSVAGAQTPTPSPQTPASAQPSGAPHLLAIIIDDCGQWLATERGFIALPIALTMSVMPEERYTQRIAQEARAAGKGVMLHLPMEPESGSDPGGGKITTGMTDDAIADQVRADLAAVPDAQGVNNHEGSKASADARVMKDVARVLAGRGLFFVDSRTSAKTVAQSSAAAAGMRTAARNVFLDNVDERGAVEAQLREAADDAEKNGSAIAIGHPRPATLEAIRALIPELERRGITFVPVADLTR